MDCGNGADLTGGGRTGVNGRFYGSDFASDDRRYESSIDPLIADELYIRSLDHRVSRLDHGYQAKTFDHSKCFHIFSQQMSALPLSSLSHFSENENRNGKQPDPNKDRQKENADGSKHYFPSLFPKDS